MLNNEQLSLLLRFHGDHELHVSLIDAGDIELLEDKYLVEPSSKGGGMQFHRITKRGFAITSAAITAANGVK